MEYTVYIGLGANLGKRQLALRTALERIGRLPGTRVTQVATFRQTAPVGGPADQPAYLNSVAEIRTELPPRELLAALLAIEQALGRDRREEVRFGPRVIDLDILLVDGQVLDEPGLTVPHPRMHERKFVLEPLAEIAPEAVHPVLKKTMRELKERLG